MEQIEVVETRKLGKQYPSGARAVDQLDLTIHRGEVYGFLGLNGAGKTTTLRMLLGLVRPTEGSLAVLGHPAGHPDALRRIGALVEAPAFYPHLSGRQNLRVLATYAGIGMDVVDEVLETVGLTARAGSKFQEYSLGMKQRLGVAAALLKRPDLLILDEPTNGLDTAGMQEMRDLVRSLGKGDRTVVLSSHLLGEVEQVCDRVGVIQRGRLIAEGTVEELRDRLGPAGVLIRATPPEAAQQHALALPGVTGVKMRDDVMHVTVDPARAGEVNAGLVTAGVVVHELRPVQQSLEEIFMDLTHDDQPMEAATAGGQA